jgi:plastocyanin
MRFGVIALVVAVGMGGALMALNAERPAPRELDVVIRDMAFYVNGDPAPNPVIRLSAGESIAVTVRNEDAGIVHDFAVPGWATSTRRLRTGESQRLVVEVPDTPGTATYQCSPHSRMMAGRILIESH